MATLSSNSDTGSPVDHGQSTDPPTGTSRVPGLEEGEDVLELCREAASMLGPNEMIHDPEFTLYGAMSALELMDAKMDKPPPALESLERRVASGTLPINLDDSAPAPVSSPPPPPPASAPAATPAGSLPASDLLAAGNTAPFAPSRRALSVLDGMAVCEVAWHEGGSLPETLYACLYLHPAVFSAMLEGLGWAAPPVKLAAAPRLDLRIKKGQFSWNPVDRALTLAVLAQSLATLRCCSLARDVIILADIFEEEDFYPSTFGFRLAPPVEDDSLTDLLALAEGAMRERMKAARLQRSPDSQGGDRPAGSRSTDERILAHLESRTHLLHACLALRDAFTNKQRLRRLRALEKRRAEELANSSSSNNNNSSGSRRAQDGAADTAEAAVAAAAAGGMAYGQENDDGRTGGPGAQEYVEVDSEVVAAAAGLAAMSVSRCSGRTGKQTSGIASGAGSGGRASGSTAGEACGNASEGGVECDAGVAAVELGRGNDRPAAETGDDSDPTGLVVEGRAVTASGGETAAAATTPMPAAPCAGTVLEKVVEEEEEEGEGEEQRHQRQAAEAEFDDDIETPLSGISRCEGHLRAAAVALESLLAIEASLEAGPEPPPVSPAVAVMVPLGRPQGEKEGTAAAAQGAGPPAQQPAAAHGGNSSKGADKKKQTPPKGFRLGGAAAAFAFEAEMNRHLLGSSPQHHVHFRRGRAEGPRALMLLAREAGRACGVVRCEDLLGARRCLLRLFRPPEEEAGGAIIGTASLFARSVAAVCLYRQDMVLGRFDVMWFVAEAMTDVGVPDAVVTSSSGMAFLERVGKPVYETLRTLCLNRARQRTSLELQMQDWRTLQAYADNVDDAFQRQYGLAPTTQRYMSKWALTEVLGLMHRYLQIGVELQLPSTHEWSGTYWYWDYVMTTKMMTEGSLREAKEQLEEVKAQIEEEREQRETQEAAEAAEAAELATAAAAATSAPPQPALTGGAAAGGGGGGSKKSKKKKRGGNKNKKPSDAAEATAVPGDRGDGEPALGTAANGMVGRSGSGGEKDKRETQKTEREISWAARRDWEMADMKLRQCLCRGTVRLVAGLESLGMMGQKADEWPEFRFTSPEIVHRERFRAFQALDSPAFQSHQAFIKAVGFDEREAADVVDASAECFRAARTLASDLLRRGDSAAKASAAAAAAAAVESAPADVAGGGASGTLPPFPPAAVAGGELAAGRTGDPGGEEAWAMDRLELLAMAKLAVSNGVAAMQVVKHSSSSSSPPSSSTVAAAKGGGKPKGNGRANLDFGSHSQFPAVKVTFA